MERIKSSIFTLRSTTPIYIRFKNSFPTSEKSQRVSYKDLFINVWGSNYPFPENVMKPIKQCVGKYWVIEGQDASSDEVVILYFSLECFVPNCISFIDFTLDMSVLFVWLIYSVPFNILSVTDHTYFGLLGCDAVLFCRWLPVFRMNVLPPFSGTNRCIHRLENLKYRL